MSLDKLKSGSGMDTKVKRLSRWDSLLDVLKEPGDYVCGFEKYSEATNAYRRMTQLGVPCFIKKDASTIYLIRDEAKDSND